MQGSRNLCVVEKSNTFQNVWGQHLFTREWVGFPKPTTRNCRPPNLQSLLTLGTQDIVVGPRVYASFLLVAERRQCEYQIFSLVSFSTACVGLGGGSLGIRRVAPLLLVGWKEYMVQDCSAVSPEYLFFLSWSRPKVPWEGGKVLVLECPCSDMYLSSGENQLCKIVQITQQCMV